jgi:hypothetical protein
MLDTDGRGCVADGFDGESVLNRLEKDRVYSFHRYAPSCWGGPVLEGSLVQVRYARSSLSHRGHHHWNTARAEH